MIAAGSRWYKGLLLVIATLLLVGVSQLQQVLNRQRSELGLTRLPPLENAPPVLALTTQALGGFRGLIANALWIRASQLQDEGKYFEMVQLADWITKLEPRFVQVWVVQAWNMAYNISVKFSDFPDRWRWVQRGIELLRDDGLRYNPNEALIYRELAWFFQHKMGMNLDDAHLFYKGAWAEEMMQLFGGERPNFDELIAPTTEEARQRTVLLRTRYKMDPAKMRTIEERYGPLDWRLPEAHAIYWASVGLERSKPEQLLALRRAVYQSMQLAFQRGRLVLSSNTPPRLAPNLLIVDKVNATYEAMAQQEPDKQEVIHRAHQNFLRDAVYQLYIHNRLTEAQNWLTYLRKQYPDALPADLTLPEFAMQRVEDNITNMTGSAAVTSLVHAFIEQAYLSLLENQEDQANQSLTRAREIWQAYQRRAGQQQRIALPPFATMQQDVLNQLLDPQTGLHPEVAARLRAIVSSLQNRGG